MTYDREIYSAGSAERARLRWLKASGRWHQVLYDAGWPKETGKSRSPASMYELVWRTYQPGSSVAVVAREAGVDDRDLVRWRSLARRGALAALAAGEDFAGASELAAARDEIRRYRFLLVAYQFVLDKVLCAPSTSTDGNEQCG